MDSKTRITQIDQALAALQGGDALGTQMHCSEILKQDSNDAEAWSILGLALSQTNHPKAVEALSNATRLEPREPRWHIHLGLGLSQLGQLGNAANALKLAVEVSNGNEDAVLAYCNVLVQMEQIEQAVSVLKRAANADGTQRVWLKYAEVLTLANDTLGAVCARETAFVGCDMPREDMLGIANMHVLLGQYDKAWAYVYKLLSANSMDSEAVLLSASLMRWQGKLDEAHDILAQSYRQDQDNAALLQALLDLNRGDDEAYCAYAVKMVDKVDVPLAQRRGLAFVLARRADKQGDFAKAWAYAKTANSLYDDGVLPEIDTYHRQLKAGLALYGAVPKQADGETGLVYVISPPRSGGSLLQTILAAQDGVASVGERGALMAWLLPILDQCNTTEEAVYNWNQVADKLPGSDIAGMRSTDNTATEFVDKMPHHAHVAGLLARLHPQAQFVNIKRDPFDMAMSIYLHDFTDKFGYSRSIKGIADYLKFQDHAVQKWQNAGLSIVSHDHSAFLENPSAGGAAVFGKLGKTWDDSYLDPKNRQSTVRTFSALQVRGKVTKAYSGRGLSYKSFMDKDAIAVLQNLSD